MHISYRLYEWICVQYVTYNLTVLPISRQSGRLNFILSFAEHLLALYRALEPLSRRKSFVRNEPPFG